MKTPVKRRAKKTREFQVMNPVGGRAKKTPECQVMTLVDGRAKKTPVEGQVKKTDPSSGQGRRPITSTP